MSTSPTSDSIVLPTYDDVTDAAARLAGVAHRTPVLTSRTADARTRATLFFKCENVQRMGAFKFRGAYNAISHFDVEQRRAGVLAYSSGNHAQAIALAARLAGIWATIVMPQDAPAAKMAATKEYGGEVITYDRYTESREEIGARLADERGMTLVPPYDHPHVIAGQGTAAKELIDEVGGLDMLVVPVGGGGLIAGSALSAAALASGCSVIGVEPQAGNDAQQSLARGEVVHIPVPRTIADGAASTHVGAHNFPIIRKLVERIVTVSDAQLVDTMRFFAERMKMVVEPTGCLAAAAVLDGVLPVAGKRVGVILSGGNVDLARYGEWLRG
ncbi:serine dehydratase [Burkholderia singularis]|uniref:Serine dehydratase n=1 Tax=Burkholderia singularis TaxID=1503053 RepID=A0A103DWY6_9BURK|nr:MULTISPECIES: threo-3-hydroxy-L-aspartate ammonia-lyase [Burkholderia]AOK29028.1 serine dehydratase [Burkholderia sp. Bp7605]KVE24242.1 serine dehydratase [Burkholderia singularis]